MPMGGGGNKCIQQKKKFSRLAPKWEIMEETLGFTLNTLVQGLYSAHKQSGNGTKTTFLFTHTHMHITKITSELWQYR